MKKTPLKGVELLIFLVMGNSILSKQTESSAHLLMYQQNILSYFYFNFKAILLCYQLTYSIKPEIHKLFLLN